MTKKQAKELGKKVKALRLRKRWTQTTLAGVTDVSAMTIWRIEKGLPVNELTQVAMRRFLKAGW